MIRALALPLFLAAFAEAAPRVEVQGHRGARAVLPENTLAAFDEALRVGVDVLELDLNVTRDGVLVVSHDKEINPVICLAPGGKRVKGHRAILSLTLKQVRSYDCGSLKNPRFPDQKPVPGQRIPTLDEVFDLVRDSKHPAARSVELNIETKIVPGEPRLSPSPERFARLVVRAVRRRRMEKRVIVQSFDHRTLAEVKRLAPGIRIAALISDNLPDLPAAAKALKAEIISPNHLWITKAEVDRLHKAGVRVIPWTVNTERGWRRMLRLGVDGIITDDPGRLIDFLKRR